MSKSEVRVLKYCYFKKWSVSSQLTWIKFWRLNFLKNNFQKLIFSKIFKKVKIFSKKDFFRKKILKKVFEKQNWKNFMFGKNILFSKIFENCFLENQIFENWSMAVRIWLFFDQLQRLITHICVTQKKHLMPLKDSTHQDLWPEI